MFLQRIKVHGDTLPKGFKSSAVIFVVHKLKYDTDIVSYTRQRKVFRCFVITGITY
jgi:hypothetical protein